MSKAITIAALLQKLGVTLTDARKTQAAEYKKGLRSAEDITSLEYELDGIKAQQQVLLLLTSKSIDISFRFC